MGSITTIGLLAHVDAGKTTLTESLLYNSGMIRKAGRVDHGDAFLDTDALERARGITIFSKQARMTYKDREFILLDTPGHSDFSPETERSLSVMDAAVLLVSAADKVTARTAALWRLLEKHSLPVFIFINKMDQDGADAGAVLEDLRTRLDRNITSFDLPLESDDVQENLALCDESLLEAFLGGRKITKETVCRLVRERKVFPCFSGSALKSIGVTALLDALASYSPDIERPAEFGARIFKISRDAGNTRLTWMKITGGCLKARTVIEGEGKAGSWNEKADQIRLYSGDTFTTVSEAAAGDICAVTGLTSARAGDVLGFEQAQEHEAAPAVLTYEIIPEDGYDIRQLLPALEQLAEEEPGLSPVRNKKNDSVSIALMGRVQAEIIKDIFSRRFGVNISYGTPSVIYKETVANTVEGVGHFEPLRHYAEVHILIEPLPPGSGIETESLCSTDVLAVNWQRQILNILSETRFKGVLTGSELTDVRFSLLTGKAHTKHTEGGDFRQAVMRAVRQGLMEAENILLEPAYDFSLTAPPDSLGRIMYDLEGMSAKPNPPRIEDGLVYIDGQAPVALIGNYADTLAGLTSGRSSLELRPAGFIPCHDPEAVIEKFAYDPEADLGASPDSVFCSHGAGVIIPWYDVKNYMHVPSPLVAEEEAAPVKPYIPPAPGKAATEEELSAIFEQTFGSRGEARRPSYKRTIQKRVIRTEPGEYVPPKKVRALGGRFLFVDGYNIIFAWPELASLADKNIDSARDRLIDMMAEYNGAEAMDLTIVFDAYKVKGGAGHEMEYSNIHVVFTKEDETADAYIERAVRRLEKGSRVTVATNDNLEQLVVMGGGAIRMSAEELHASLLAAREKLRETFIDTSVKEKRRLFDDVSEDIRSRLKDL